MLTMTQTAFSDVTQTQRPATRLPSLKSDIDGWQCDGIADDDLDAIFEDFYTESSEITTQGLVNETKKERYQSEKGSREELIDLYAWRFENGLDVFTGKPLDVSLIQEDFEREIKPERPCRIICENKLTWGD